MNLPNPLFSVGRTVWYNGPTSGCPTHVFERFKVIRILTDNRGHRTHVLKRVWHGRRLTEFAITGWEVESSCYADTPKVRRLIGHWKRLKKEMDKTDKALGRLFEMKP